jgi:CBS-domain-containing membrane protein
MTMGARDIMTRNVVSVKPDATLEQATNIMLERRISGLPVVEENGRLVGMLTEGDLLRRSELGTERHRPRWLQFLFSPGRLAHEYAHTRGRQVGEVMSEDVVSATEETELDAIIEEMSRHDIKRVPIVAGEHLVGIVSRADIMRALNRTLHVAPTGAGRDDAAILQHIQEAFRQSDCIPTALVGVSVHNGDVELRGCITDERERAAIHVAVENVPGVKAIHDHLIWVETMSGFAFPSPEDEAAEQARRTRELEKLEP